MPTVVIQGASDELVRPRCGRELAAGIPGARLELLSGGHMTPYTHAVQAAAAINGLAASSQAKKRPAAPAAATAKLP